MIVEFIDSSQSRGAIAKRFSGTIINVLTRTKMTENADPDWNSE